MSKTPDKEPKQGSLFGEEPKKTPSAYDREYTHGPRNRAKTTKKKGDKK
jgi:hypothetical protein